MGADRYTFVSTIIVGIPIPTDALESKFKKKGFKIVTIKNEAEMIEYHGAFLCLKDTVLNTGTKLDAIGPYEITERTAQSKRMGQLDKYLPNDVRDALINEYESFLGEKPEFAPGFWMLSCTSNYSFDLHSEWAMKPGMTLEPEDDEIFSYEVKK